MGRKVCLATVYAYVLKHYRLVLQSYGQSKIGQRVHRAIAEYQLYAFPICFALVTIVFNLTANQFLIFITLF